MKPGNPHKKSTALLLLFLSLIISIGIAEVLARRAVPPRDKATEMWARIWLGKDDPDILLDRRLRPNASLIYTGWWAPLEPTIVVINSYGFRDYEYPLEKPQGVKRIVGLGESRTFGQGVELEETYLKVLESLLAKRSENKTGGGRWQVLNFGVPGYNAAQKVALFEESGLQFSPDIVVIYVNDYDNTDDAKLMADHLGTMKLLKFLERRNSGLAWLAMRAIERHLFNTVRSETAPDNWSNVIRPIEALAGLGQIHGFKVVVFFSSNNPVNESMVSLAGRDNLLIVDLAEGQVRFGYDFKEEFCLHPKDCHPTPEGHRVMAQVLFDELVDAGLV